MSTMLPYGNVVRMYAMTMTKNWPSVAAATTDEVTLAAPGVKMGDFVIVEKTTLEAGLGICSARVSAEHTVKVTVVNATAGAIDEGSEEVRLLVFRPEGSLPTVIPA